MPQNSGVGYLAVLKGAPASKTQASLFTHICPHRTFKYEFMNLSVNIFCQNSSKDDKIWHHIPMYSSIAKRMSSHAICARSSLLSAFLLRQHFTTLEASPTLSVPRGIVFLEPVAVGCQ